MDRLAPVIIGDEPKLFEKTGVSNAQCAPYYTAKCFIPTSLLTNTTFVVISTIGSTLIHLNMKGTLNHS